MTETNEQPNNAIESSTLLAVGNACALGNLTMLDNPEGDREDWEPYKVKYALLIEFESENGVKKAIKDGKCQFTIFGG
jgi:hypothetical protein